VGNQGKRLNMIDSVEYLAALRGLGFDYFSGVPDSLLKDLCACIEKNVDPGNHVIASNEGAAIALATGYHLGTGKVGVVYMQNSGLGNCVNPITSLADEEVYSIPMLLLIGWRGKPGEKDEPQHVKQGRITLELLKSLGIPYGIHSATLPRAIDLLKRAKETILARSCPFALVIEKGTFASYTRQANIVRRHEMRREDAIKCILDAIGTRAILVSTTGMISREVYELRESEDKDHSRDFLTVGSMGHSSQIALAIAAEHPDRTVVCLDGDGAAIMHMGSMATVGCSQQSNLIHVVLNNGAHDSVGGQPTVGFDIDFVGIAKACGYSQCSSLEKISEIRPALAEIEKGDSPGFLEVRIACGARANLGRPKESPLVNKEAFMKSILS
jgi:phosphonopyruvate decarboxylase